MKGRARQTTGERPAGKAKPPTAGLGKRGRKETRWRLTEVPGTLRTFDLILTVDTTEPKVLALIEKAAAGAGLAIERC